MQAPVVINNDRTLLEPIIDGLPTDESSIMRRWMLTSAEVWVGMIHRQFACCWGVVPPTLLSDEAYLWMYHTPKIERFKFLFVRNSQLAVEDMLTQYNRLYGHVKADASDSKRWLGWLGARLLDEVNGFKRFEIRKRLDG